MSPTLRLVVFNALMMRALVISDNELYRDELAAFRVAFQGRRFKLLITEAIVAEYQANAKETYFIQLQPALDHHLRQRRAVFKADAEVSGSPLPLSEFPKEHRAFIRDAIAARAEYLVTRRRRWLALAGPTETAYALRIVTPGRFVELEGYPRSRCY